MRAWEQALMASNRASESRAGVWATKAPPMRHEAHFGDRVVRCFVTRPCSINCSDARRDAMPAWERIFCRRSTKRFYHFFAW